MRLTLVKEKNKQNISVDNLIAFHRQNSRQIPGNKMIYSFSFSNMPELQALLQYMEKPMLCLDEVYHTVVHKTTLACTVAKLHTAAVSIDDYSQKYLQMD